MEVIFTIIMILGMGLSPLFIPSLRKLIEKAYRDDRMIFPPVPPIPPLYEKRE